MQQVLTFRSSANNTDSHQLSQCQQYAVLSPHVARSTNTQSTAYHHQAVCLPLFHSGLQLKNGK